MIPIIPRSGAQATALPMYTISTMEAAIRPLSIASNSSCGLLPFLDWILQPGRVMDYRFGFIKTVRLCYRTYKIRNLWHRDHNSTVSTDLPTRTYYFLHAGLLNERGIENWLEIELTGTSSCVDISYFAFFGGSLTRHGTKARGTVTFAPTNAALVRNAAASGIIVIEQTLSVIDLAMQIREICDIHKTEDKHQQVGSPPLYSFHL